MNHENNIRNLRMNQFDNIQIHNKFETKYLKYKQNHFNNKHFNIKHRNLKQFDRTKKTLHKRTLRW